MSKNNSKVNDLNFRLQVITTVAGVLNLYWDLVSFDEDLRIKQKALETAQQLVGRQSAIRPNWERCRPSK